MRISTDRYCTPRYKCGYLPAQCRTVGWRVQKESHWTRYRENHRHCLAITITPVKVGQWANYHSWSCDCYILQFEWIYRVICECWFSCWCCNPLVILVASRKLLQSCRSFYLTYLLLVFLRMWLLPPHLANSSPPYWSPPCKLVISHFSGWLSWIVIATFGSTPSNLPIF